MFYRLEVAGDLIRRVEAESPAAAVGMLDRDDEILIRQTWSRRYPMRPEIGPGPVSRHLVRFD